MQETYRMMRACTNEQLLARNLDDLVHEYKQTNDARQKNKLISTIFIKVYPMILKLQKKYYSLTAEQKMEHALFHLVKSLNNFTENKVKFSTFLHLHLSNQFSTLLTTEWTDKRAVFQNIVTDNDLALQTYCDNTIDDGYEQQEKQFIQEIKDSSYLSSEEKTFCTSVLSGFSKANEIGGLLNLAKRLKLKSKCVANPLIAMNKDAKEKAEDAAVKKYVTKIKEQLKQKRKKYHNLGIDIFRD